MWTIEQEAEIDQQYQQNFDEYMERGRTRAAGYNKSVRDAYDVYWNRNAPGRAQKYRNFVGTQKKERLTSALKFESTAMLETGNRNQYDALLTAGVQADLIERPAYDDAMKNFDTDSTMSIAHRLSQVGDYNGTIEALGKLDKDKIPTDRLETYNKILKYSNSALTTQTDTAITDGVINMYNNRNLPPENRMEMENDLVDSLINSGLQGTDLAREVDRVATWVKGDPDKPSNAVVKGDLDLDALQVINGSMTMEKFNAKTRKARSSNAVNDKDYIEVRKTANREMDSNWTTALTQATMDGRRQIVDKEESAMEIWMQQALSTGVDDVDIESEKDKQKMQYQAVSMLQSDLQDWIDKNGTTQGLGDFNVYRDERIEYYDAMKVDHIRNEKTKRAEQRLVRAAMPDDEKGELTESDLEIEASIIAANMSMQKFIDPSEAGYNDPNSFDNGINRWKENTKYYLPLMDDDEKKALDIFLGPDGHPDQVVGALLMLASKYGMPSNQTEVIPEAPVKEETVAQKEKRMKKQEAQADKIWGGLK